MLSPLCIFLNNVALITPPPAPKLIDKGVRLLKGRHSVYTFHTTWWVWYGLMVIDCLRYQGIQEISHLCMPWWWYNDHSVFPNLRFPFHRFCGMCLGIQAWLPSSLYPLTSCCVYWFDIHTSLTRTVAARFVWECTSMEMARGRELTDFTHPDR